MKNRLFDRKMKQRCSGRLRGVRWLKLAFWFLEGLPGFFKHSCHFVCLEEGLLAQVEKWKEEGGEGFNCGEGLCGGMGCSLFFLF